MTSVIGKLLDLRRESALIQLELKGFKDNVRICSDTAGFTKLSADKTGSFVKVEANLLPPHPGRGRINILEVIGIYIPPITIKYQNRKYKIVLATGQPPDNICIIIDCARAVWIPWWHETIPPKPGEMHPVEIAVPAKNKADLAVMLKKIYSNVIIAA